MSSHSYLKKLTWAHNIYAKDIYAYRFRDENHPRTPHLRPLFANPPVVSLLGRWTCTPPNKRPCHERASRGPHFLLGRSLFGNPPSKGGVTLWVDGRQPHQLRGLAQTMSCHTIGQRPYSSCSSKMVVHLQYLTSLYFGIHGRRRTIVYLTHGRRPGVKPP